MRTLISGATGLIGGALSEVLRADGHEIVALSRSRSDDRPTITWSPAEQQLDAGALEGFDAVVHLAGEPIIGRWSDAKKSRIRRSRVQSTGLLAGALAGLARPPKVFLCASAIGIYGDRGDERLPEGSTSGAGFLADVCVEWEAAAEPARAAGIRTVHTRFGLVLSRAGGALRAMLIPFRLGLGGPIGSGDQYWAWVAIDDVARALHFLLRRDDLDGPFNIVAPEPVTCRQFTRTLGRAIHRPAVLPVPAFAARLAMGEAANETVLASTRAVPQRLREAGFEWREADLEEALGNV